MNFKPISSSILITLTLLGTILAMIGTIPNSPIVPSAYAAPPNNPAVLGLFSEVKKSSAVVDTAIKNGALFKMDINITDAGPISGFDINITWASTVLSAKNSTFNGPGCSTCVFAPVSTHFLNVTVPGSIVLSIGDNDPSFPFVNGNGVLFRVTFNTLSSAGAATTIHIVTTSLVQNPSPIRYDPIDGYYNRQTTPTNYSMYTTPTPVTIPTPLNATDSISQTTTLDTPASPTGLSSGITLNALGLPINTAGTSFSTITCTTFPCTSILTVTIHGGPKGGPTTTPSGTYSIPLRGNASATGLCVPGSSLCIVRETWLKLVILPPPATVYTFTASPVAAFTSFALQTDPKIKYVDTNANNVWDVGESVIYDTNNDNLYTAGEPVLAGATPAVGTALKTDPKIRYSDFNGNGVWNRGEEVLYDSNNNGLYDTGEPAITGTPGSPIPSFTQQAGNYTLVSLAATLLSGSNDSMTFGNNCYPFFASSLCLIKPQTGSFLKNGVPSGLSGGTFTSTMNVTTSGSTTTPNKTYFFNLTSTSQGTYSEVLVVKNIQIAVTVLKTHDLAATSAAMDQSRTFGYSGYPAVNPLKINVTVTNLGTVIEGSYRVNATAKIVLTPSYNLKYIVPTVGQSLQTDPHIKFVNATNTPTETWAAGKAVVYDFQNKGIFYLNETVIAGNPAVGAKLKSDPNMKYIDSNGNAIWDSVEAVLYDTNANGLYDTGEPVIANSLNSPYSSGETVVVDSDGNGLYGVGKIDSNIRFVDANSNGHWDSGETVIYDATGFGSYLIGLKADNEGTPPANHFKYVDTNGNNVWNPGETVVFDSNNNNVYDAFEPVIAGSVPAVGTALKTDPLIKYLDVNNDNVWQSNEPVAYDTNNNNLHDPTEPVIAGVFDTVITGTAPANGASLSFDPKIAFADSNNDGIWESGETVFYDTNGNSVFDSGEAVIVGAAPSAEQVILGTAPALGTKLNIPNLSFMDSNFNGVLDSSKTIVFDTNGNGLYDAGEPVVRVGAGKTPPVGIFLLGTQPCPSSPACPTLAAGQTAIVTISWDPSVLPIGTYLVGGTTLPVTGEYNLSNNAVFIQSFTSKLKGDVDGNCLVNILDVGRVTGRLSTNLGDARYDPAADLNNDGHINILDVGAITANLQRSC